MLDKVIKSTLGDAGLGVPRRMPLGELLLLITLFCVVFRVLTLIGAPAVTIVVVGCFILGIAFCQAMLFGGRRPRDASMIAGAILCPSIFLIFCLLGSLGIFMVDSTLDSPNDFISAITFATLIGPVLGYFAGLFVAAWFYLFDFYRSEMTGASRRYEAESNPESSTHRGTKPNKSTWLRQVAGHLWPIRPSEPMRGAKGALLCAVLSCLVFAPAFQLGYWNILSVAIVALLAAFLTGMFQLPWYCVLLASIISVLATPWAIQNLYEIHYFNNLLDETSRSVLSFVLCILASFISASTVAIVGWIKLVRTRWLSSSISKSTRRVPWFLLVACFAIGLATPLAYAFAINRFANTPRMLVAKKITTDGGEIDFGLPTFPTSKQWPVSMGASIKMDTLATLKAYNDAFPEGVATSYMSFSQPDLDSSSLTPLESKRITYLVLFGIQTDHALDNVKDFTVGTLWVQPNVEQRMKFGDNSLAQLARMPGIQTSLQHLAVRGCSVTNIQPIEKLTTLTKFRISNCPITSNGIQFSAKLPGILEAGFDECPINDQDLKQIVEAMPSLNSLDLSETKITDEGLAELTKLKLLINLDLSGTEVTDKGLCHLEKNALLESVRLRETNVTEEASEALSEKLGIEIDWEAKRPDVSNGAGSPSTP